MFCLNEKESKVKVEIVVWACVFTLLDLQDWAVHYQNEELDQAGFGRLRS